MIQNFCQIFLCEVICHRKVHIQIIAAVSCCRTRNFIVKICDKPEHFAEYLPDYQNLDELKAHYTRGGLGDVKVKKFLNNVLQEELAPIRERRKMWEQRIPDVYDILKKGTEVAEKKAAATLKDVRAAMQINYFD